MSKTIDTQEKSIELIQILFNHCLSQGSPEKQDIYQDHQIFYKKE